jgi:peptidoglycan/xylan/chitin deacetylase (PgdA/CDA1 family)
VAVYRWVMECAIGRKLRPDEFILHACDHPPCYRLDHLSVGSALDNNRDMITKGRHVPPPVTRLLGAMHPQAKFTSYQAARIRQDFRTGVRAITLAQEYGVDVRTIRRLVEGITYADTSTPDLLAKYREDQ